MEEQDLTFEAGKRFWSSEREAVNFFARHDGIELEFIVMRDALKAAGSPVATLSEESALVIFDNYEDIFLAAATRVWRSASDSKPVYFIHDSDLDPAN